MTTRHTCPPTKAERRLALLRRWWAARRDARYGGIDAATNAVLREIHKQGWRICRGTLYRWELLYQGKGLDGLRDGRQGPRHTPDSPFLDLVARLYFGRKTVRLCYELAKLQARERGWNDPGYRACTRAMTLRRAERARSGGYTRR